MQPDKSVKAAFFVLYHWENHMRLDKYLKVSRLIKRRTIANEACDAGRVLVNGKTARASYDVKCGDILELQLGMRTIKAGHGRKRICKQRYCGRFVSHHRRKVTDR